MKAIVYAEYGSPDVLQIQEIEKPFPKENELLIRVYAVSVNYGDITARNLAIEGLNKYVKENPESDVVHAYLNQMKGIFDKDANARFELTGSEKANCVFVGGINHPNISYFLIQKEGKWIGEFRLPPGEYHYIFLVDGKRVQDPNNHDIVKDEGLDYNRIFVKN